MFLPEQREEICRIVLDMIQTLGAEFRKGWSSTEIARSTAGKPSFVVKVYDTDAFRATNTAREIEAKLAKRFFAIESEESPEIEKNSAFPKEREEPNPF